MFTFGVTVHANWHTNGQCTWKQESFRFTQCQIQSRFQHCCVTQICHYIFSVLQPSEIWKKYSCKKTRLFILSSILYFQPLCLWKVIPCLTCHHPSPRFCRRLVLWLELANCHKTVSSTQDMTNYLLTAFQFLTKIYFCVSVCQTSLQALLSLLNQHEN